MHQLDLILTLAGGFIATLVPGLGTQQRLGLSPIGGYLLAGIVIGPRTPGFVANKEMAERFSEIGVILLMFGVGLQFHCKELLAVRRVAIPGALVQSAVATLLGAVVVHGFDWSWPVGIVFGLTLSVASTAALRIAGADCVFTGEGEVALAMTEFILGQFNATREQIDRERERIREELFDKKTG
ncbi:cation:proton antiporter [Termitidicoccus mucosus]|uniref:Cation/H+ exchanger transmembrane domain-containing protein n=1 Tax=Termitidicoccus mucosus TaxID=1184151 RepID=A0A178IE70_9BACT|nr:hypothetical protein AW736_19220 [Opitutaceae bacterium TSB47]